MPETTYSPTHVWRGRPRPRKGGQRRFLRGRSGSLKSSQLCCVCVTDRFDTWEHTVKGQRQRAGAPAPHIHFGHSDDSGIVEGLSLIHISEPTRLGMISYAVFCLKKKKTKKKTKKKKFKTQRQKRNTII